VGVDADGREAPAGKDAEGRVVEWFRMEPRSGLRGVLLPAVLCATFGWLLLSLAGRMISARSPYLTAPLRSTLPSAAVVDAQGNSMHAGTTTNAERATMLGGTLLVMLSPVALVARLRRRSRAPVTELLLRTDALVLRQAGEEVTLPWDQLEEARLEREPRDKSAKITLARHDGSELELEARYVGITPDELLLRIRAIRGRALFGLLEPPAWPERARGG
jgi:hypothetical protein